MFYYFNAEMKYYEKPAPIYGASWNGYSTTAWTRTDDAVGFSDPSPAVNNGNGSSPFDDIMPWSGMVKSENADAGTLVAIPKFYFKLDYANPEASDKGLKIQISMRQYDGFQCSPAHMDRGDGAGERDIVYVGRYHCASTYKSTTGVKPLASKTRSNFRSGIHNLGSNIWQWDYATLLTIQMLYLVEFANWDSQAKIGYGCGNNTSTENMGSTNAMQYHTGTNASSRTTYGHVQYRNIEDLWGNVYDWVDGVYFSGADIYVIKNPSNFSDTSDGINVGTRPSTSGYIYAYNISSVSDYKWFMYPIVNDAVDLWDYCYNSLSGVAIRVGGYYTNDRIYGLFYLSSSATASYTNAGLGSRLMYLP